MLSLSPFPSSPPVHRTSTPSTNKIRLMSRLCSARGPPSAFSSQISPCSSTRKTRSGKRPRPRPAGLEEEEIEEDRESLPTVTDTITTVATTCTGGSNTINDGDGSNVISSSFLMVQGDDDALVNEATCVLPDPPRRMEEVPCYNSPLHKPRNAKVQRDAVCVHVTNV